MPYSKGHFLNFHIHLYLYYCFLYVLKFLLHTLCKALSKEWQIGWVEGCIVINLHSNLHLVSHQRRERVATNDKMVIKGLMLPETLPWLLLLFPSKAHELVWILLHRSWILEYQNYNVYALPTVSECASCTQHVLEASVADLNQK